jgi:hypothetical protein
MVEQPATPAQDFCRIELALPSDLRALGVLRGALEHTAKHLGFPELDRQQLIENLDRVCRAALGFLPENAELVVLIQEHPDRLEVELEGPDPSEPKIVRDAIFADVVETDHRSGHWHWKLVKFLGDADGFSGRRAPNPFTSKPRKPADESAH